MCQLHWLGSFLRNRRSALGMSGWVLEARLGDCFCLLTTLLLGHCYHVLLSSHHEPNIWNSASPFYLWAGRSCPESPENILQVKLLLLSAVGIRFSCSATGKKKTKWMKWWSLTFPRANDLREKVPKLFVYCLLWVSIGSDTIVSVVCH